MAATKNEAASSQQPRPRAPVTDAEAAKSSSFLGLPPDAPAEDIEYVLGDVRRTLSRLDTKRVALQDQIAAASRGKRRAAPRRALPVAAVGVPVPAAAADDPDARYTRRSVAGAVRRKLRAAAGDVKKERKRLEAVGGELEEALVDARVRLALQQPGERTA